MRLSPKSKTGPKLFWTLRNQKLKFGPRKLFSDWVLDWANRPKFVKSYKQAQKEFWAQEILEAADRARITRWTSLGINVIQAAQFVICFIYFTSVVKLGKPKTSGPIFFMLEHAMR